MWHYPFSSFSPSLSLSLQFTLMNYRVTGDFINSIPFRVYTTVEDGDIPKLVSNNVGVQSRH